MRIGRTLPPAAAPIGWKSLFWGMIAILKGGAEIERFSDELKDYFGQSHCFLVSSGKAALTLILRALKEQHPDRNEVIIPAYTCYSVPSAIIKAGLEIKLCDLAENSLDYDFVQLEPMLKSDKLLCVLPTHLFGLPADVYRLQGLINDPKVTVVEDAAQAMGGEWQGEKLGTLGDVGFFSLGRGKAFSTVEGGIILTDNDDLADRLRKQMESVSNYTNVETFKLILYVIALNLLLHPLLFWLPKGLPFLKVGETIFDPDFSIKRMTAFQAGLSKDWAGRLRLFQQIRQNNLKRWLDSLDKTFCPFIQIETKNLPALIRLPVLLANAHERGKILREAEQQGLGVAIAYPDVVSGIPECADRFRGQEFPDAKKKSQKLVTFPIHLYVKQTDIMSLKKCLCAYNER